MESWIIYALLSGITAWFYNFSLKMVVERKYNAYVVTFYDYLIGFFISFK